MSTSESPTPDDADPEVDAPGKAEGDEGAAQPTPKPPQRRNADDERPPEVEAERLPPEGEISKSVAEFIYTEGPLPPPAQLEGYRRVQADAPERILAMAEAAQRVEHEVRKTALNADIEDQRRERDEFRRAQYLTAALLALLTICGLLAEGWYGGIVATICGTGLIGALFSQRRKNGHGPTA